VGYQRCWAQKSADHRGDVHFNGLVCTLLSDEEVKGIMKDHRDHGHGHGGLVVGEHEQEQINNGNGNGNDNDNDVGEKMSMTEGLVYTIPKELVKECLEELDFREKGGYARDLITVIVDDNDEDEDRGSAGETETKKKKVKTIQAMLYRGTPDNPAFSNRAMLDELYAASIMAVAKGPSGGNDVYLYQLDEFLSASSPSLSLSPVPSPPPSLASSPADATSHSADMVTSEQYIGDTLTKRLTALSKKIQEEHQVYFLYGSGSNQHNQLLLESSMNDYANAAKLVRGDEAHDLKEIVLLVPKSEEHRREEEEGVGVGVGLDRSKSIHRPKKLFAGGGHSAMLTHLGDFYLWGWNDVQQLGREYHGVGDEHGLFASHPIVPPLEIKVESAALGHNHTLIIEKETGILYAFGDDNRGQVSGTVGSVGNDPRKGLTRVDIGEVLDVSAGLFHSAAITNDGELVTFGCGRFGQTLTVTDKDNGGTIGRWRPSDGSRLVKVACGRRHTVVLDEFGRVYTMGDNKYNQLGRELQGNTSRDQQMELVEGFLGQKRSGCVDIDCGWSHCIAVVRDEGDMGGDSELQLFGWGRNDKSQLASVNIQNTISTPQQLKGHIAEHGIKEACCGAESISVLDGRNDIVSSGWNEHGNLAVGHSTDVKDFTKIKGARICSPFHSTYKEDGSVLMASGGGHFFATIVSTDNI